MRRALALLAVLALTACQPEAPPPDPPQGRTLSAAERLACRADRGKVEVAGALGMEVCFRPEPDAGKACTRKQDCSGFCMADTGSCSVIRPQFGCFDFLDDAGQRNSFCID